MNETQQASTRRTAPTAGRQVATASAVEIRGLTKKFGDYTAVDAIDLDIHQGEVFGLLGPNGAGKTTTINMLDTLLTIDDGYAAIFGIDVAREPHKARQLIGVTGQYASVDEKLTGRENLQLIARLQGHGHRAARSIATGLLGEFGLMAAADKPLSTFSGGMRRRLDLAVSLVARPPLIFLDEPTADQLSARLPARSSLVDTWNQTMGFAGRALKRMRREPEQFSDVAIQPILFTVMFGFILGGAISGDVASYLPTMVPGILGMTCLTASMATGVQLREDMDTGIFNRFKTLPVARIAPLAGPMVADLIRYLIAASLTFLAGIAIGYRPEGGVIGVVAAIVLVVITGWSLSWAFAYVGAIARSAQSVQGIAMMTIFPLSFLSNAFVPVASMPGWLQWFVHINPVSHVVSGVRALANAGTLSGEVGWALLGCAVVIAIFAPLTVKAYQREQ